MAFDLAVSLDGPTASGKTTLAAALAWRCHAWVLDTGLTFRAVAYAALHDRQLNPADEPFAGTLSHQLAAPGPQPGRPVIVYSGDDITDAIWSAAVETRLRAITTDPAWRQSIADYHRRLLMTHQRVIAVGRDVATTLLTEATCNVYLTAVQAIRRERRRAQYRDTPDRAVTVGVVTELDAQTCAFVASQPRGLVLDTTFLPPRAALTAVLHKLGGNRDAADPF